MIDRQSFARAIIFANGNGFSIMPTQSSSQKPVEGFCIEEFYASCANAKSQGLVSMRPAVFDVSKKRLAKFRD